MEVLVVGAGEMGRWIAQTLHRSFDIAFVDRDDAIAVAAAETIQQDADRSSSHRTVQAITDEPTPTFSAVCLAVPITAIESAIINYADRAEQAIFDITGVMQTPVEIMQTHCQHLERHSLHPLFAAANAPGNVAFVPDAPGPVTDTVIDTITETGNHVFQTTPSEHDTAMQTVQASAHAAVLAYALAAADVRDEFATPVSRALDDIVATVTNGTPRVYQEIQTTFQGADKVASAARRLADADPETFNQLYIEASNHT
ncbi:MAG: prephenate dehydrogenase [Haloquadratum walsbyi J07HQW1]|uniref:Prephenate dehydrogenase n=1 Tax=Haloquadratum walsbyi J07HQW1 TaxID=1238424 RepID=U1PIH1_9EURY|nr:MAG: prephenate dehydrogenase [Haloquadratum walsbyi J07HQW1]